MRAILATPETPKARYPVYVLDHLCRFAEGGRGDTVLL